MQPAVTPPCGILIVVQNFKAITAQSERKQEREGKAEECSYIQELEGVVTGEQPSLRESLSSFYVT